MAKPAPWPKVPSKPDSSELEVGEEFFSTCSATPYWKRKLSHKNLPCIAGNTREVEPERLSVKLDA
jgi:hypothetical protein